MAVLNLFPARVRFVNDDGTLTNEAFRALQILLSRVGGPLGDTGTDTFSDIVTAGATSPSVLQTDIVQAGGGDAVVQTDVVQPTSIDQFFTDIFQPTAGNAERLTGLGGAAMLATTTALTNGAGAAAGTIANAPAAGNPTKWVAINDSGTTRYIPAW